VVHGFAARAGRFDGHGKIFFELTLADKFAEALRTKLQLERGIVFDRRGGDQALASGVRLRVCSSGCHF
jgi:hypothetical protein